MRWGCFLSKDSVCALQPRLFKISPSKLFSFVLIICYIALLIHVLSYSKFTLLVILLFSLRLCIFFSFILFYFIFWHKLWYDNMSWVEAKPNPLVGSYDRDNGYLIAHADLCCCHVSVNEAEVMLLLNQKSVLEKKNYMVLF